MSTGTDGSRLAAILLWSVIAAAFIGPGTVTTCASAGAHHGTTLLWVLTFSTVGCFILQEAAARVAVGTGHALATVLRGRAFTTFLVAGAIVFGCAAYQAGNVVGAAVGASRGLGVEPRLATLGVSVIAACVLWVGTAGHVARAMGIIVAVMAGVFVWTSVTLRTEAVELLTGALVPRLPPGSGLLVIALVGTTIVPYNLFLGSSLAEGQRLDRVRVGLAVAIGLGGLVSAAIVVVGTAVGLPFSLGQLADTLARRQSWAGGLFLTGLFCAGLSSAVTAPLAAAVTARGLFGSVPAWDERGWRYRSVWIGVCLTGLVFGLSGIRPVPLILVAQALNGLLLPVVAGFLLVIVNDRALMGRHANGLVGNLALGLTWLVTLVLGGRHLVLAARRAFEFLLATPQSMP